MSTAILTAETVGVHPATSTPILTYHYSGGNVASKIVQQDKSGAALLFHSTAITSNTANGVTVWLVASETVYPEEGNSSNGIMTSYLCTFDSESNAVLERVTTLPAVSTNLSGSRTAVQRTDRLDRYDNLVWSRDERGFLT